MVHCVAKSTVSLGLPDNETVVNTRVVIYGTVSDQRQDPSPQLDISSGPSSMYMRWM